jgi:hypothetical protein
MAFSVIVFEVGRLGLIDDGSGRRWRAGLAGRGVALVVYVVACPLKYLCLRAAP